MVSLSMTQLDALLIFFALGYCGMATACLYLMDKHPEWWAGSVSIWKDKEDD